MRQLRVSQPCDDETKAIVRRFQGANITDYPITGIRLTNIMLPNGHTTQWYCSPIIVTYHTIWFFMIFYNYLYCVQMTENSYTVRQIIGE